MILLRKVHPIRRKVCYTEFIRKNKIALTGNEGIALNWLQRFMMGRYGVDQMTVALLVCMMVLTLLSSLFLFMPFYLLAFALMIWSLFRILSRNRAARARENEKFLVFWNQLKGVGNRIKQWFRNMQRRFRDRKTYLYFKCPNCKKELRVPRGKGNLEVTCPLCRSKFMKKS